MKIKEELKLAVPVSVILMIWFLIVVLSIFSGLPNLKFTQSIHTAIPQPKRSYTTKYSKNNTNSGSSIVEHHTIVLYNPAYWYPYKQYNKMLTKCPMNNCNITANRTNLRNQSAVIYFLTEAPGLPATPPLSPSDRNPNQVWIFSWLEAPARHPFYGLNYRNANWRGTVNWTLSYTLDSEVYYPYGGIRKRTPPVKNYSEIFHRKNKMAAWVVSNCNTQSQRMKFVNELRRQGVEVDMYGRCAGKRVGRDEIRQNISQNYKFYLAFENSFCKDYITEKFFSYFELDVILVVRGGGNYSHFLSNDSFVNSMDFSSVKTLADHLRAVAGNESLYKKYLESKDNYEARQISELRKESVCSMCEKLNNLESNRRVIQNYWKSIDSCFPPADILNSFKRKGSKSN